MVSTNDGGPVIAEKVVRKEVIIEKNNEDLEKVEENLKRENERVREQLEAQRRMVICVMSRWKKNVALAEMF